MICGNINKLEVFVVNSLHTALHTALHGANTDSGPCILRPPIQLEECGHKEVVLKWMDIYNENIGMVSLMAGLKLENTTGLKLQGPVYFYTLGHESMVT